MLFESKSSARVSWQWLGLVIFAGFLAGSAAGQPQQQQWRALPAKPYVLRGADRRLLDRAERFLANEQWDDAVAALMRLLESNNPGLVPSGKQSFISLRKHCQRLLATLPDEPLTRYRELIDPTAESCYREGVEQRDGTLLQRVVDQYFCSSWGDDALIALGEFALERGEYQAARNAWLALREQHNYPNDRLLYPDVDLPRAMVEARLILVAIREGDWQLAETELQQFRDTHPDARGRLGGRDVVLAEHLTVLLQQAQEWPTPQGPSEWSTFAANPQRTYPQVMPDAGSPHEKAWSVPLVNKQLSVYPIIVKGLVVFQDDAGVHAHRLSDGQIAFETMRDNAMQSNSTRDTLGSFANTLSATDDVVYGVTPTSLGPRRVSVSPGSTSKCWGLDLSREGALGFEYASSDPKVSFAGAPLVVDGRVYVAIRSNDLSARVGVACIDLGTGQQLWERWLCQSNTPATGVALELASNLLCYDSGTLYVNTNLGAIAAVRALDGEIQWLRSYDRHAASVSTDGQSAYYRGPNPCVFYRGLVYALPTDSRKLMGLDASTGDQVWQQPVDDSSATLFGASDEGLAVLGRSLRFLDRQAGALIYEVAESKVVDELPKLGSANLAIVENYLVSAGRTELSIFRKEAKPSDNLQEPQSTLEE